MRNVGMPTLSRLKIYISVKKFFFFMLFRKWLFILFKIEFPKIGNKYFYVLNKKIGWFKWR